MFQRNWNPLFGVYFSMLCEIKILLPAFKLCVYYDIYHLYISLSF